jgi:hypothetical protein
VRRAGQELAAPEESTRRDEESGASEWGGERAERAANEWIRESHAVERVESRVSGFGSRGASVAVRTPV